MSKSDQGLSEATVTLQDELRNYAVAIREGDIDFDGRSLIRFIDKWLDKLNALQSSHAVPLDPDRDQRLDGFLPSQRRAMESACLDLHAALDVEFGHDPYTRIRQLKEAANRVVPLEERNQWQSIETAPSGHAIIVYVPENESSFAAWYDDHPGRWKIFGGSPYAHDEYLQRATHWQPLPLPPQGDSTNG